MTKHTELAKFQRRVSDLNSEVTELLSQGLYRDASRISKQAIALCERHLSSNDQVFADSLYNYAEAQFMDESFEAAKQAHGRALEIRRQLSEDGQDTVAQSLVALAACHSELKEYDRSEECFREAFSIRRALFGEHAYETGVVLMNWADLCADRDELDEAEEKYQAALEAFSTEPVRNPRALAVCLSDLGLLNQRKKLSLEAEEYYLEAIAIYEHFGAPALADLSVALENLGDLYKSLIKYDKAVSCFARALEIGQQFHREDHPKIIAITLRLANLHLYLGDFDEALVLYQQLRTRLSRPSMGASIKLAECLRGLAEVYRRMGQYDQAEPLYHQAKEQLVACGADKSAEAGQLQNDLGIYFYDTSHNREAWAVLITAGEIFSAVSGKRSSDYAQTLSNLGLVAVADARFDDAERLYREALDITRENVGNRHPLTAICLHNLGDLYRDLGRSEDSEPLLVEAASIISSTLGHWHPYFASALKNLGELRLELGSFTSAGRLFRLMLKIQRKAVGEKHPSVGTALHALARYYSKLGDDGRAKQLYIEALQIEEALGIETVGLATTLSNLGLCCENLGETREAETFLSRSLQIRRQVFGEWHPEVAYSHRHLAGLYESISDMQSAIAHLKQSNAIMWAFYGEDSLHAIVGQEYLARMFASAGQDEAALALYEDALSRKSKLLPPGHAEFAYTLSAMGDCLRALGKTEEAEAKLVESKDIFERVFGRMHLDYAAALNSLAWLHLQRRDFEGAEKTLNEISGIVEQRLGKHSAKYQTCLFNKSILRAAQGRVTEALELLRSAEAVENQIIGEVFGISSDRRRMAFLMSVRGHLEVHLSLLAELSPPNVDSLRDAFMLVLRRKGLLLEALASQRQALLAGRYPELAGDLRTYNETREMIAVLMLAEDVSIDPDRRERELAGLRDQLDEVEARLARQISEVSLNRTLAIAALNDFIAHLPSDAVLIEFLRVYRWDAALQWTSAHYIAFVCRNAETAKIDMIDLGIAEEIDQSIEDFRDSIGGHGLRDLTAPPRPHDMTWRESGIKLRALVFDPLVAKLGGRTRLFLAPDGDLTRLPFEALPTPAGHLIDDYLISYLNTGRYLLRFQAHGQNLATAPIVAADPDFDLATNHTQAPTTLADPELEAVRRRGLTLLPLVGAREEGRRIAELLGVKPRLGAEVLERELKAARSPRILHLATHGIFLADPDDEDWERSSVRGFSLGQDDRLKRISHLENPLLRSFLALAGANTWLRGGKLPEAAEDGLLTAEDVSGLDLLDTDLVVLSACDTALGSVRAGEGVFGLQRAFVLAGAKTLVMSQWKVPDDETGELMQLFYTGLLDGKGRAVALRDAQLTIKAREPHPLFWAAFICQGDPGPLARRADGV